jgi:hypothetical protein
MKAVDHGEFGEHPRIAAMMGEFMVILAATTKATCLP